MLITKIHMSLFIILAPLKISAYSCKDFNREYSYDIYTIKPLMKAAEKADIATIKKLIKEGGDVNAVVFRSQPHGGKPVLRYAIDSHSLETVQTLLNAGANPNDFTISPITINHQSSGNIRNLSLLSHAINSGAPIEIIKELINYGADIEGKPKICGYWTPLMIAAYRGNTQAAKLLLSLGANNSECNKSDGNKTALDYATEKNHTEITKMMSIYPQA